MIFCGENLDNGKKGLLRGTLEDQMLYTAPLTGSPSKDRPKFLEAKGNICKGLKIKVPEDGIRVENRNLFRMNKTFYGQTLGDTDSTFDDGDRRRFDRPKNSLAVQTLTLK